MVDRGRPLKNSTGNGIDKVCQRKFTLRNYIIWFYSPSFKADFHSAENVARSTFPARFLLKCVH